MPNSLQLPLERQRDLQRKSFSRSGIHPSTSRRIFQIFRPMLMPGSMRSTRRIESQDRSRKPDAGACETQAVRACRHRVEGARPEADDDLADRFPGGSEVHAIFMLERSINGLSPEQRVAARCKDIAPLVNDLIEWMKRERAKLSRHNEVAKAMDYMLKRIDIFTRFLEDGRICLSNNAAERGIGYFNEPSPRVMVCAQT